MPVTEMHRQTLQSFPDTSQLSLHKKNSNDHPTQSNAVPVGIRASAERFTDTLFMNVSLRSYICFISFLNLKAKTYNYSMLNL